MFHFAGSITNTSKVFNVLSEGAFLGVHFRGTAADYSHGFIAEVITIPATPAAG